MTDWAYPEDVDAVTVERLHQWIHEGNPADAATSGERAVRQIIHAFWPEKTPTLAEELRKLGDLLEEEGGAGAKSTCWARDLANDAEKIEQERDKARSEVDRLADEVKTLAAENSDLRNSVTVPSVNYSDGLTTCSDATVTSPADVKPGEAWLVELDGQRATALKDNDGLAPWSVVGPDGRCRIGGDTAITLVSRLVPAPRVITDADKLDRLPMDSVVKAGCEPFQQGVESMAYSGDWWYRPGDSTGVTSAEVLARGTVTVLWEAGN